MTFDPILTLNIILLNLVALYSVERLRQLRADLDMVMLDAEHAARRHADLCTEHYKTASMVEDHEARLDHVEQYAPEP